MKIAVLGAGKIGSVLGTKWANAGHHVMYGVRDVNSANAQAVMAPEKPKVSVDSTGAAIAFGEVILFAVPGSSLEVIVSAHSGALANKILVDATNNIGANEMSGMLIFSSLTPSANVYRAFNALGWENFEQPQFGDQQADLFFCGPDESSDLKTMEQLIREVGLRPVYIGGPEQTPILDNLVKFWFSLAMGRGMGRHLAFKMLT